MTSQPELSRFFGTIKHRFNEPLAKHTFLKIGGPAYTALFPQHEELQNLIKNLKSISMPYILLGGCTNVVIDDEGLSGAVIFTNNISNCEEVCRGSGIFRCGSGMSLAGLLSICADRGLSGMEGLSGIPGTLGGALYGNSGSFGFEMKDVVKSIDVINSDGDIVTVENSKIGFRYRSCNLPEDWVILSALIKLQYDDPANVREKIKGFRREKIETQPVNMPSAGCAFRNHETAPAGRLIDEAGCKGMRVGGIEVSPVHANFFVNIGGGTAADYIKLMDLVRDRVAGMFSIELYPEVRILKKQHAG
ncbi:MAG: UDP-N-acetylmuramate dehydrogenase [Dissulfurispiraceae bacterium]|jgi:UDP-N-acetylmuramate dehydrogenase|nr:UDP-N-acetylmuramate dehydrogenase [Dissulfurispiraceae bacterium]